jgi:hypothetical protein
MPVAETPVSETPVAETKEENVSQEEVPKEEKLVENVAGAKFLEVKISLMNYRIHLLS